MLETQRLLIRKFTHDDLPWLVEMRSAPEMNKFLGGTRLQNPDAITKRLDFYIECYEKLGFGVCGMFFRETGEPAGWSGLQPLEDTGEIEIGYGVAKKFWKSGLGFECAQAWLKYGFETAGLERIIAVAVPENTGSRRIMEKCGMKYERNVEHYGMDVVLYSISKADFLKTAASGK
jgi:ribosomal-protein-alanine N-acetyltransferase